MEPRIKYVITFARSSWWGAPSTLTLIGKGSSMQNNELLIHSEDGGFVSINYNRVLFMTATPLDEAHSH